MFKELKVMKTNILVNNTNMKQYIKYLCAVVLMLGMSISAWGEASVTFDKASLSGTGVLTGEDETLGTVTITGSDLYQYGTPYWSFDNISDEDHISFYATPYAESFGTTSFSTSVTISYLADEEGTFTADLVVYYQDESETSKTASIPLSVTIGSVSAPTLSHDASGKELTVSGITSTGATFSGGVVTNKGGADITRYGFTIGTSSTVVIGGTGANAPVASGFWDDDIALNTAFGSKTSVSNFSPNTTYYVRAFAYNGSFYGYSTAVQFKTLKQFTITLDGNGVSDGIAAVEENAAELIEITAPTRDHYTLEGYYTTSECDTKIANTAGELVASITVGGNAWTDGDGKWIRNTDETFYANWTPDNQTISFNANGGSSTMESVERAYNSTYELPACTFTAPAGKVFKCWAEGSAGGTERAVGYSHTVAGDITFYAKWRDGSYTDYVFSCAELTLTAKTITDGAPIFITSAASKTVRSQDSILVVGNGLTPNTTLTYPGLPSKFAIKTRLGANLQTDVNGEINAVAYIYYTPDAGDETDGLDKLTGISVSVGGAKPITKTLTQSIIGRHLSADFVIAVKRNGKWYALPDTMTGTWNPKPVEIAVDDIDNPTIAYTATTNVYNLYGQVSETIGGQAGYLYSNGHTIKLGMKNNATYANYPLFGSATGTSTIGKGGTATSVTNNIGKQYWWVLTQTNTSIENAQDAKYSIKSANNTAPLILKENAGNPQWGFFTTGSVGPIRLIPASESTVVNAEASVVAWGKNSAIIESEKPYDVIGNSYMVGKLPGGIKSDTIPLTQTGTSVKGTGTRYNYTVNFGVGLDFSANEGQMLTLEWFNGSKVLKAVSNVTVPRIVASNTTINSTIYPTKSVWNTEVHVLPGDTLTIDASGYSTKNKDVTIKELNIYPGAAVIINKDTLKATNLVLRSGWSRIGEKIYAVGSLYINPGTGNGSLKATNAYMDWYIDYDQYYPIAVPWKVATSAITYKNMTVDIDQGLMIRYYDGERHAKGGDGNTNWKQYSWVTDMPTHLVPGIGYAITARRPAGKAFSIIRMPLTIPSAAWTTNGEQGVVSETHKDQVEVIAWVKEEGETPKHAKGWNFIANPYMCIYQGGITHDVSGDYDIEYVNIPDVRFKEFDQVATDKAKLKPGSGFLIQTEETGKLTFGTSNRKVNAPSYVTEAPKASKQKAYIILNGEEAEDEMGLIISNIYTADYEINADLEKLLSDGNTLRTYMIYNNINMAYVAINEELAKEWIPVTVRIPESGEYTYSLHEASKVGEMEGIYLIDYSNGQVTNLIMDNYSFTSAAGTIEGRFAINAIIGKHDTPTDIDIINAGGDIHSDKPVKFIWNDKVFILHNGVIYDSTGKKVREINK